ncbi:hypothetical protein EAH84_04870 [Sphingomonas oligophenolica]|uniref:Uncharacterized protein n=1 Tax=Sphingomonas oligophenolica TaxID=301154 RepID=A0A502CP10_9SPHN|nr:hypothetical protein EAH84_04870 [Sphingomonas oligophenolica]
MFWSLLLMYKDRDFDGSVDALLARAIANDRDAAELIWSDIAQGGTAFVNDHRWIRHVARKIARMLIDDNPESKARAQLALQALGMVGRSSRDEDLYRELVASRTFRNWDAPVVDDQDEPAPMSRTAIARDFIRAKLIPPTLNVRAAAKRLDRIAGKFDRTDK